jgi:hypothetical protein
VSVAAARRVEWLHACAFGIALCCAAIPARAADGDLVKRLQGAWVPSGKTCGEVFFRQGTSINFVRPGADDREGVLIAGTVLRDGRYQCSIQTSATAAGAGYRVPVTCFSGLRVALRSFALRIVDEDTMVRGAPEGGTELRLRRCRL